MRRELDHLANATPRAKLALLRYAAQAAKTRLVYRRRFARLGPRSRIISPLKIHGAENISIGERVTIEYKTWLGALPLTGETRVRLEIGAGSQIGHFNHIYATKQIVIGRHVLTADNVYISDNLHEYTDVEKPIMSQGWRQLDPVEVGDGSWLGENVCVVGAKIGKNCVIGANSVVTRDIPDYSVAVGAPAIVLRQYFAETGQWRTVGSGDSGAVR